MKSLVRDNGTENAVAQKLQAFIAEFNGLSLRCGRVGYRRKKDIGVVEVTADDALRFFDLPLLLFGMGHRLPTASAMHPETSLRTMVADASTPFLMAVALLEPWPTRHTPLTPSRGAPP